MSVSRLQRHPLHRARIYSCGWCFAIIGGLLTMSNALGDERLEHQTTNAGDSGSPKVNERDNNSPDKPAHKAQRRDVDAVLVLLVLTMMVIILAFAGLLIWGRRVRRLAREPLKSIPRPDELWYLRGRQPGNQGMTDEEFPDDSDDE